MSTVNELKVGVIITIQVIQKSLLRFYKILVLVLIQVLDFWMKEETNKCNHNLHLLQSDISTNFYNYRIYFNRAGTHLRGQLKFTFLHIFYHCWAWILIGVKVFPRIKFQILIVVMVGWSPKVHLVFRSWFFLIWFNGTVDNL